MFVLDLSRRISQRAPIDGAGDKSHWGDTRLMIVRLRIRPTEGTAVRTSNDLREEPNLGPALPCRPCQHLPNPEGLHGGRPGRRLQR